MTFPPSTLPPSYRPGLMPNIQSTIIIQIALAARLLIASIFPFDVLTGPWLFDIFTSYLTSFFILLDFIFQACED